MSYRVLVVEDDLDWQLYFQDILSQAADFEATALAGSVRDAKLVMRRYRFDAALIDVGLPDGSGLDVLTQLSKSQPDAEVAICTIFEDERTVLEAIRRGASGYILKVNAGSSLVEMLSQMMAGGAPISPKVARYILNSLAAPSDEQTEPVELTKRESDVLNSISTGQTLKQAARSLGIAESTVRTHVKRIYSKLDVNSRGAALLEASRRRIL
ncbi:DNA-binding NarL/FixJ family response regulator [Roseinatronobacter thiooxidans]|uniref:DNA-binding NarL/FixJ family response regulator n=1 Tax=Roseinatronobacter thiooxidans TaxID=121821 RepID=A0A2W7PP66_9RHOB|nr:response regulator transcription factor [Roseinatronobacter thiooxidans]PZX37978.1 DNA-binding NarL/FixJ family response regulator [Roseinatronobacter thiooxidans]